MSDHDLSSRPTISHVGDSHRDAIPSPDEIAKRFPHLEILDVLGQGGMGVVYKARHRELDRLVAIKILLPGTQRSGNFAERFSRESRALARLQHPNIVMVHDSGKVGDMFYFVMEYVDGRNLREVMVDGKLPPEQALAIVPLLCDALQYAHDEGIVHRDIKPENILLDKKGRVKIADFGVAKLLGPATDFTLTSPQQAVGTMHYMAPEQIERPSEVDHRADIYALGVVLYEVLTGELPLGRFPLPSEKVAVDSRLDQIVLHALEKEPDRRYQRVDDVKSDVETVSGVHAVGLGVAAGPAMTGTRRGAGLAQPPTDYPTAYGSSVPYVAVSGGISTGTAYLLWLACLVGVCGLHRFYAGRWITGIIWICTGGVFMIGQFIDLLLIPGHIKLRNLETAILAGDRVAMGQR